MTYDLKVISLITTLGCLSYLLSLTLA